MQSVSILCIAVHVETGDITVVDGPEPGPHSSSALYRHPQQPGDLDGSWGFLVGVREDAVSNRRGPLWGDSSPGGTTLA